MQMGLNHDQMLLVAAGTKTVEIRLNDRKRRELHDGDLIEFTDTETGTTLVKEVAALETFTTFVELYTRYGGSLVGSQPTDSVAQMVADTYTIYSREQEREWGVLAIHIK